MQSERDDLGKYSKAYFIGAGGIGMANLERYLLKEGYMVAGYDRTSSELTRDLEKEGVRLTFMDKASEIPEEFRNPGDTLVVFTPAVPDDSEILTWFRTNGFEVVKRSE